MQVAHLLEHVVCEAGKVRVTVARQILQADLLPVAVYAHFEEHARAAVRQQVAVFSDYLDSFQSVQSGSEQMDRIRMVCMHVRVKLPVPQWPLHTRQSRCFCMHIIKRHKYITIITPTCTHRMDFAVDGQVRHLSVRLVGSHNKLHIHSLQRLQAGELVRVTASGAPA